jgi:hypothetical protein
MKVLHLITRMNTGGPAVFLDHLTHAIHPSCESVIGYGYCEGNETDYTENHELTANLFKLKFKFSDKTIGHDFGYCPPK